MIRIPVCINLDAELVEATKTLNRSELVNDLLGTHLAQRNPGLERTLAPLLRGELKPLCDAARKRGIATSLVRAFRDKMMTKGVYLSQWEAYSALKKAVE